MTARGWLTAVARPPGALDLSYGGDSPPRISLESLLGLALLVSPLQPLAVTLRP